jgi:alanine racemase
MRATHAEIDLSALERNYRAFKNLVAPSKIMAVVKADAYGHGMIECARRLKHAGCDYFGVAFVEEGIALRQSGINDPIHVYGGLQGSQIAQFIEHDFDVTASSLDKLRAIEECGEKLNKRVRVQLKIDTGLERIGTHYYSAEKLIQSAFSSRLLDVVGVYSHFARADEPKQEFTKIQLERFLAIKQQVQKLNPKTLPTFHIANSAAALSMPESRLDMVRIGLGLYGVYPAPHLTSMLKLEPVLSLKTKVVYFKCIKAGAGLSYGHSFVAPNDTRIVTLPIGYADGYPRSLSNCAEVLIRGRRYPVRGTICMDQLMVDIGADGEAYNGDEVVLIGGQLDQSVTANELANKANTIPYEILSCIGLGFQGFLEGKQIQ